LDAGVQEKLAFQLAEGYHEELAFHDELAFQLELAFQDELASKPALAFCWSAAALFRLPASPFFLHRPAAFHQAKLAARQSEALSPSGRVAARLCQPLAAFSQSAAP